MSTSIVTTSQLIRPQVAAGSHPIENGQYVISTPPIDLFYKTLLQWIENPCSRRVCIQPATHG